MRKDTEDIQSERTGHPTLLPILIWQPGMRTPLQLGKHQTPKICKVFNLQAYKYLTWLPRHQKHSNVFREGQTQFAMDNTSYQPLCFALNFEHAWCYHLPRGYDQKCERRQNKTSKIRQDKTRQDKTSNHKQCRWQQVRSGQVRSQPDASGIHDRAYNNIRQMYQMETCAVASRISKHSQVNSSGHLFRNPCISRFLHAQHLFWSPCMSRFIQVQPRWDKPRQDKTRQATTSRAGVSRSGQVRSGLSQMHQGFMTGLI
jgi:hypothetical protein